MGDNSCSEKMRCRLNGISNATCRSPSLNGPNLDSGVLSYQMFPLRTTTSGSERLHGIFPMNWVKSKNSQIEIADISIFTSSSSKPISSRDLVSFLSKFKWTAEFAWVCDCKCLWLVEWTKAQRLPASEFPDSTSVSLWYIFLRDLSSFIVNVATFTIPLCLSKMFEIRKRNNMLRNTNSTFLNNLKSFKII